MMFLDYFETTEKYWEICTKKFDLFIPFCCDFNHASPIFLSKQKNIFINPTKIHEWYSTTSYFDDFHSFCQLVFLHELGHYYDDQFDFFLRIKNNFFYEMKSMKYGLPFLNLLDDYKIHLLQFEQRAWEFAIQHNSNLNPHQIDQFQDDCLKTYEKQIYTIEQIVKIKTERKTSFF